MHTQTAAQVATKAATPRLPTLAANAPHDLEIPRDPLHDACLTRKDVCVEGRWHRVNRQGHVAVWVRAPGSSQLHHLRDLAFSSKAADAARSACGWFGKSVPAPPPPVSVIDRAAAHHEREVERLARDIEAIIGRQESVKDDDLLTLGWSLPQIAELAPDALKRVRGRAVRHLDPIN